MINELYFMQRLSTRSDQIRALESMSQTIDSDLDAGALRPPLLCTASTWNIVHIMFMQSTSVDGACALAVIYSANEY